MKKWEEIALPFTHGIESESQIISKAAGTLTAASYGSPIADAETWDHFWENGELEYVKCAKWDGLTKKEQLEARANGGVFKGTPLCKTITKGSLLDKLPDVFKAKIKKIYTIEIEKEGHKDWFVCCDYEFLPGQTFRTTIFGADTNSVSFKILEVVSPPCNKLYEIQNWMTLLFEHSFKSLEGTNCGGILSTGINPVLPSYISGMTCGDHHHLGNFASGVDKIKAYNFIRNYLPHLVALSANSPLFDSSFYENKGVEGAIKEVPKDAPKEVKRKFFTIGAAQSIRLKFNQNQLNFTPFIPLKEVKSNTCYEYFQKCFIYGDLHTVAINPFKGREKALKKLFEEKTKTAVEADLLKDGTIEIRIFDSQLSVSRRIAFVALLQAMALHAIRMDDVPEVKTKCLIESYTRAIEMGLFAKLTKDEEIPNLEFRKTYNTDNPSPRIVDGCHNLLVCIKKELTELGYMDLPILSPLFASIYGTEKFEPPLNPSLAQLWIYYKEKRKSEKDKTPLNFQSVLDKIMQISREFNTKYISDQCEVIQVFGNAKPPTWLEQKIKINIDNTTTFVPNEEIKYYLEIINLQETPLDSFSINITIFEKDSKKVIGSTEKHDIKPLTGKQTLNLECKCIAFPDFDSYYIIEIEILGDMIKLEDSSKQKRITIRPIPFSVIFHYGPKMISPVNVVPISAHFKHGIEKDESMHITTKLITLPSSGVSATKVIATTENDVILNKTNQVLVLEKEIFKIKPPIDGFASSIKANLVMDFKIKSFEFHKISEPYTIMYKPPTIKGPIIEIPKDKYMFGEALQIKIKIQSPFALNQSLKLKIKYLISEDTNKAPVFEMDKDIILKDSTELTIYDIPPFILDQKKMENSPKLILVCAVLSGGIQIGIVRVAIQTQETIIEGETVEVLFPGVTNHQKLAMDTQIPILVQIKLPKEPISHISFVLYRSGKGVPITQMGTRYDITKKTSLLTTKIILDNNTPYIHWELLQENVGIKHIVKEGAFEFELTPPITVAFPKFAILSPNVLNEGTMAAKTQVMIDNDTPTKFEKLNLLIRVLSLSGKIMEETYPITVNNYSKYVQDFSFITPFTESKNPFENYVTIQAQLLKNDTASELVEKRCIIAIGSGGERAVFTGAYLIGSGHLTMAKGNVPVKGKLSLHIEIPLSKALLCEIYYKYTNKESKETLQLIHNSKIEKQPNGFQVTRDFMFTTPKLADMKENKLFLQLKLKFEGDTAYFPDNKIQINDAVFKIY